jgi:guanylate kinase
MERNEQQMPAPIGPKPCPKGRLFVVSGPSGVGKDTLLEGLYARVPALVQSISATTRARRPQEIDGGDYHFLTPDQFRADIEAGRFLEYAIYGDSLYGTPADTVADQRARGLDVVLKIEVQGASQIRQLIPDAVLIFIAPPSLLELERRLRARNTDSEERIADRLRIAADEMARMSDYDYVVVNSEIDAAVDVLRCVVVAERHRNRT